MKPLTQLKSLKLQGYNEVDDESLAVLATFPMLRELDLKGTSVTGPGTGQVSCGQTEDRVLHRPMGRKGRGFSQ
jgi:hypothetical protein